ncbi:MAG: hypothetical protein GOP50_13165 [Candidatus Heimdallarchaeota archaeon]|nr:hypothetical protein [Candidatus Heimdallarchaeota archaeon]
MISNLPIFVRKELEFYQQGIEDSVEELFTSVIGQETDEIKIRQTISNYFSSKTTGDLEDNEKVLLLGNFLLCYWSKEYETIIEHFLKFKENLLGENLSIHICYLLSVRDMFLFEEYNEIYQSIEEIIEKEEHEKSKEYLTLALQEFSAVTQKRPDFGFKALNELLRYLSSPGDDITKYSFILDALMTDLVNFAYTIADDTLKDLWLDSAVQRAETFENKGMESILCDLLVSLSLKEYDIKGANKHLEKGLSLAKKISSERLNSILLLNSAVIEKMKGDLASALEIYKSLLKTSKVFTPIQLEILEKMGDIYLLNEEMEKTIEFYNQAHEINEKYNFPNPMIEIVYGYINLLEGKDEGEILEHGMKLAQEQFDFNAMSYYFFYKGMFHQKKVDLATAVKFFERSLEFFENQVILEGILYTYAALVDIYFEMYRITDNNDFALKFLYFVDNLIDVTAEIEHSIYIDAIMTKAGYYRFRNMEEEAEETLKQGIEFAGAHKFDDRVDELNVILEQKKSLIQELRGSRKLFSKIRQFSFGTHKKIPIILYLLLVIDEGGLPLYSYNFSKKQDIDDLLISGLISAIINFSQEVLGKGVETLRSIIHEGRSVIIERQDNVMAVLVSDNETFESRLQVRKFLKEAMGTIKQKITAKTIDQEEFQPLVETIFKEAPFTVE